MARTAERRISLDPTGKKIGIPEPQTAASVVMLELLLGRLRKLYSGKACLRESEQEALINSRKCLLVREGEYVQLKQKLYDKGIMEFVCEKRKEINRLFGVPKDKGEKQRLILNGRRSDCYLIDPEYPEVPHPGLFI